jgi:hypothetical protein
MLTTSLLICARRDFEMLADHGEISGRAGALRTGIHKPAEWFSALIGFMGDILPGWRDDPARDIVTGETKLTAQLCARLNSVSRHTAGWDFLQFRREEPDETDARRAIDLAAAPSGGVIWIEGREYTEYCTLLPIECKRLPTPSDGGRDEREYLISKFSSTGGVQRFKAGHHGAGHERAAMIGYVQAHDIAYWESKLDGWIDELVEDATENWSAADKLAMITHDGAQGLAELRSKHFRRADLGPVQIDHLWIEMRGPPTASASNGAQVEEALDARTVNYDENRNACPKGGRAT